ncbi:ATP-binding protein [Salipiger bermudensis]|uniref:ATP-binding protein n=1 Tax=Salipiger bermudensis TaxID=344736 RepID=UPI001CD23391|nr:ATP-binding protein [Salipiger bermudensis]MCA0961127.1 response regulator [Salipiger bermudensis]
MSKIVTMIESASVMLLAVLAVSMIYSKFSRQYWTKSVLLGLLFAFVGILVMENSVEIVEGIRTDPRGAVVVLSAAFGGPLSVAITAPCLAIMRLIQGGMGAGPGAIYILGVGLASGLAWVWWFRIAKARLSIPYVVVQSVIAGTVPAIILLFVSKAPWEVFFISNALSAPTNFAATLIMGTMLVRDLDRADAIKLGEEKQAQINAISEHAPVVLFQIVRAADGAPSFTYVSRSAESILGIAPGDLLHDFTAINRISDTPTAGEINSKLNASEEEFTPWSFELQCLRHTGSEKWLRVHSGIRKDLDGRTTWDGSFIDITEEKIAAKLKDEFISTVSHELRTPLTSIRGALRLVIGKGSSGLPEKVLHMLNIADRNSERLVLLINDILDMQKIRAGQMQFSLSLQDLQSHAENALASSENYAPEKEISFVLDDRAAGRKVNIDPIRFDQVLANLLSNAIKFSPKGGTVTLSILQLADKLRVSVKDEGVGIRAEYADQIFQPFSQSETSSTRSVGGTGLGLSISKGLIEAMDGHLSFESVEGHGATFHIDLPAIEVPAHADHSTAEPGAIGRRLLICSDDKAFTQMVKEAAQLCGLFPDSSENLDAALSFAKQGNYAALLVDGDTIAPEAALEKIRRDDWARHLPVIVASREEGGMVEGAIAILPKEATKTELQEALNEVLSSRQIQSHVLYVEDDAYLHEIFQQSVGDKVRLTGARTLAEARAIIAYNKFDLVLLDLELPDGHGAQLLPILPPSTSVIVFSAHDVDTHISQRASAVFTKSRTRETDVVEAVLNVLDASNSLGSSNVDVL